MKVRDLIKELEKQNQDNKVFMFYKTSDRQLTFTSDITTASKGAVYTEYGELIKGVLIMKENK